MTQRAKFKLVEFWNRSTACGCRILNDLLTRIDLIQLEMNLGSSKEMRIIQRIFFFYYRPSASRHWTILTLASAAYIELGILKGLDVYVVLIFNPSFFLATEAAL